MQLKWSKQNKPEEVSWLCIKILFAMFWLTEMWSMLWTSGDCLYPVGICKWYHFNFLFTTPGIFLLAVSLLVFTVLYLFEKQMPLTTGALTLLSCLIISHSESSGIFLRATPYTTVLAAQFIAYFIAWINPEFNLALYRQQYAVQIIAATYTVAAISKLSASGLNWPHDGSALFAAQTMKGFSSRYFDTSNVAVLQNGYKAATLMLAHKQELKLLLWSSLLLELFCFAATLHPKLTFVYGIGLALMHLGIYYYMDILIGGMVFPMVTFFINPLYIGYRLFHTLSSKRT